MTRTVAVVLALLVALGATACTGGDRTATWLTGGDPERGRRALRVYGCHTCHTIPGVPGAYAVVAPSLARMASRAYIAGHLPNTPDNLVRWIRTPQEVDRGNAMPDVGVSAPDSLDIAAYLYTLK